MTNSRSCRGFKQLVDGGVMTPVASQPEPDDFVFLRDVAPSIRQDIRYAGTNNLIGWPLAGYVFAWQRPSLKMRRYNPAFSKTDLFRFGYTAEHSGYPTGAAAEALRAPEASVDMGTGYDCSDPKAHTRRPRSRPWTANGVIPWFRRSRGKVSSTMPRSDGISRCSASSGAPMIFRSRGARVA